jgi:hypothetical protein
MMRIVQDASPTGFLSSAGSLLYQDEPTNSLMPEHSGTTSRLGMGQKIYKIETVLLTNSVGELRLAQSQEADLITQWFVEFGDESLYYQVGYREVADTKHFLFDGASV